MKSIRDIATREQRKALRKVKTLPDAVKAVIYGGNLAGPSQAVQFNQDLRVYGLWEALLYVENYESDGHYKPGTALQAFHEALR